MPNLSKTELTELKDKINTFHQKGIEAAKWGIVYFVNAGEGLHAVREALPPRMFKPWLEENFEGGRTTAYRYIKLAEEKGKIKVLSVHRGEQIESMRKAFAVLGAYYEEESTDAITDIQAPITAIQTPESPPDDGASLPSSEPPSLANEGGGSPAPTEAEQTILDHEYDEYQCYLCNDWFFADQMKALRGNRYCYSCRQEIPEPGNNEQVESTTETHVYETTLFDEPVPDVPPALPETNSQAADASDTKTTQDPYDEMLALARVIFPLLSNMMDVYPYATFVQLSRFIDLFTDIHQL